MAWLYKRGGVWWIGWRHQGQQHLRSTGETDKARAQLELEKMRHMDSAHKAGALTEEYFKLLTGKVVRSPTLSDFLSGWLKESEGNVIDRTMLKYKQVVREFKNFTQAEDVGLRLDEVKPEHVSGFLADKRQRASHETVSGFKRILGSMFQHAQNLGHIRSNPVALARTKKLSAEGSSRKRPFTDAEVRDLYAKADEFWKYMILAGYFTGQSLGDLVTLNKDNVDLDQNVVQLQRRKTKKRVVIPLAPRLRECFVSIWPKGGAKSFWPEQADRYLRAGASSFSQEFYELMVSVGLVSARDPKKKSKGVGRAAEREETIVGFHNFRHTFTTRLKVAGAVDSVAKELVGHRSSAINTHYTHLPLETLREAIRQLPEVVK